jgi:hypothetical protein
MLQRCIEDGARRFQMTMIMMAFVRYGIYICEVVKRAVAGNRKGVVI